MRICIVGGGNIGTTLACYIKHQNPDFFVSLLTQRPQKFSNEIKCNDWEQKLSYTVKIDCITSYPAEACKQIDIVFLALPHFAVEEAFCKIAPFISSDAFVGVLPGGGGCEFFFRKYFTKNQTLFGFQRVPFTAKLELYGHETNLKSWKPFSVLGTNRQDQLDKACELVNICGLQTRKAPNFLSIALTPTNPILHTSRIYELFGKTDKNHIFSERRKFYVGWTNETSRIMLTMDKELHNLLDKIPEIDTSTIRPLAEHYESPTIDAMTKKINSIATFQTVYAPMIENKNGFVADLSSRMFTEDFPWGLAVIRSYCEIIGTDAPMIDKVLNWYADYMNLDWYENGIFCGKDLEKTGVIQNYGIKNKNQLKSYYVDD